MREAAVELEDAAGLGPALVDAGHHVERDVPALGGQPRAQLLVARQVAPAGADADVGRAEVERPADEAKRCDHRAAV